MRKTWIAAACVVALAGMMPAAAEAQAFITPFAGMPSGGDAPKSKITTGVSLAFMGDVAGFEVDLGYTPDFFAEQPGVALVADSNVTTLMGNLLLGVGEGKVRPYVVGGLGLVRSRIELGDLFTNVNTNEWGVTAGGGVTGTLSERVGLRGDVRYIRGLQDPDNDNDLDVTIGQFDFWRATAGVVFKF